LAKRHGNNPCLIGAAGVGKTSVARGIAQRIAEAEDVLSLDDRIIIEIPLSELIAGTGVRGALASRLGALRKEVAASANRVVLFFDEIHQLFAGEAAEEIGAELKLALAKGELPCIGATTREDYAKVIEADQALARRFSVVEIEEPSREDAYLVLEALSEKLSVHHRVAYDDAALALTIGWSVRYLPGRALPDKAVSIVDLAGARARRRGLERVTPEAVAEIVAELADMPVERLL
jgi:ATP-dependent Clp protease ATP-binding subunit ClpC